MPVKYIVTPAAVAAAIDLVVAHRAARLHDGLHARGEEHLQPVGEREERVRGRDGTASPSVAGARDRELARVDPVDLAHADADGGAVACEQDRRCS